MEQVSSSRSDRPGVHTPLIWEILPKSELESVQKEFSTATAFPSCHDIGRSPISVWAGRHLPWMQQGQGQPLSMSCRVKFPKLLVIGELNACSAPPDSLQMSFCYVVWSLLCLQPPPRHFLPRQQPQALPVGSIDNPVDRADTSPGRGPDTLSARQNRRPLVRAGKCGVHRCGACC